MPLEASPVTSTPAPASEPVAAIETPVAPAPSPASADPTPSPVAPLSPREEIYARYAASVAGPEAPPEAPVVPPVVETPPAPVEVPVVPVAPAPASPPAAPDATALILERLLGAVSALEARTAPPPAAVVPPPPIGEDFVNLLRDGDIAGATKAMRDIVLAEVLATQGKPLDLQTAVTEATNAIKQEAELNTFLAGLRTANAEVVPLESYIATAVQSKMDAERKAGLYKTQADYVAAYKAACSAEYASAKAILQGARAAGRTEATTSNSVVLASTPIAPTPVTVDRGLPTPPPGAPDVSPGSYLAKRVALQAANQGLT